MRDRDVVFHVNGPARLLMACVIGDEVYPDARKTIILLRQFGYHYDALLPHVRDRFDEVVALHQRARRYSHLDQIRGTYLDRHRSLDGAIRPGGTLVLFGLRSPVQKHLIRRAKFLGIGIDP